MRGTITVGVARQRPRKAGRKNLRMRALVITMVGAISTLLVGAVPVTAADSGTVDAEVTVSSAAACIELSATNISFGTLALGAENAPGSPVITVTNCADADATLLASGTDATGPGAAWNLVKSAATCADTLGTDNYHLTIESADEPTPFALGTSNTEVGGLAAGDDVSHAALISTACPGSTGAGLTMSMQINYLATAPGTEPPIALEPLPATQETAQGAADFLFLGSRDVNVAGTCSGDVLVACPGGVPSNPAPQVRQIGTDVVATQVVGTNRWDSTATVRVTTLQPIPVSAFGFTCSLAVNTAAGPNPDLRVASSQVFTSYPDPGGPTNVIQVENVAIHDLDTADFVFTGGFGCDLLSFGASFYTGLLQDTIEGWIGGSLCGAPEPDVFEPCPALP